MNPLRISILFSAGILAAALLYFGADYLAWRNRIRDPHVVSKEEQQERIEADIAAMRAHAKTAEEKRYVSFIERSSRAETLEQELNRVRIGDGIDQYEAWILGRHYALCNFGICGVVNLPVKNGSHWKVPAAWGSDARRYVMFVEMRTGEVTCDTLSPFRDEAYSGKVPNQPVQPTPGSVTPRASAGTSK